MFIMVVAMCMQMSTSVTCADVHRSAPMPLKECIEALNGLVNRSGKGITLYCMEEKNGNS